MPVSYAVRIGSMTGRILDRLEVKSFDFAEQNVIEETKAGACLERRNCTDSSNESACSIWSTAD